MAALAAVVLLAVGWGSAAGRVNVVFDDKMKARPIEGYVWFVGLDRARPVGVASVTSAERPGDTCW